MNSKKTRRKILIWKDFPEKMKLNEELSYSKVSPCSEIKIPTGTIAVLWQGDKNSSGHSYLTCDAQGTVYLVRRDNDHFNIDVMSFFPTSKMDGGYIVTYSFPDYHRFIDYEELQPGLKSLLDKKDFEIKNK